MTPGFAKKTGRHVNLREDWEQIKDSIMLKALADRLAEALAECLHQRVRREFWGYDPDERFTNSQLGGWMSDSMEIFIGGGSLVVIGILAALVERRLRFSPSLLPIAE